MKEENEKDVFVQTRTNDPINTCSTIGLHDEQIARIFYQVAKNRLQHVNSWSIIAGELAATFQLVNKEGIEMYRKAQEGDYLKMVITAPAGGSGKGYEWLKIESLEDVINENGDESLQLYMRHSHNPMSTARAASQFDIAPITFKLIVTLDGKRISTFISDVRSSYQPNLDIHRKSGVSITAAGVRMRFSHIQWQKLADGLLSR